jgi:lipopolysaccharide biosynthesis glycosyltransferase
MIFEMGIISARKGKRLGLLLAVFWIGTVCYFWLPNHVPDFLNIRTKSQNRNFADSRLSSPLRVSAQNISNYRVGSEKFIHVCITSDKNTLGGMVTLMNSIVSNTRSQVKFHLVVDSDSLDHINIWLKTSPLKAVAFEVKAFPLSWVANKIKVRGGRTELGSPLNYARYYLPKLFPNLKEKVVFIDDDCIVQGDIRELYNTTFKEGHLAAFSEDCVGVNKRLSRLSNVYAEFIDFKNEHIKQTQIKADACSFNTGVFVADLAEWHKHNITDQLEYWMDLNTKEEVYGNERGGGGSQPPMMIVFYNKHSPIDPMWHVRYLGWTSGSSYSKAYLQQAKLLHWNGKFKPWGRVAQHSELWDKYFLPDPRNEFRPVRRT